MIDSGTIRRRTRALLATPSLHCPDCGAPMRLLAMVPSLVSCEEDQITYRCEVCGIELTCEALQPAA
jgi:transcription elongation factor Elf1